MAQNFNISPKNCFAWTTEKPFTDVPRISPSFSIADIHCYLHLGVDFYARYTYYVNLHGKQDDVKLEKEFEIITLIKNSDKCIITSKCTNINCTREELINFPDNNKQYSTTENGQWCVLCIFPTDLPVQLDVDNSETMKLSSFSEMDGGIQLNSSKLNILTKAKLAACAPYGSQSSLEILSFDFNKMLEQNVFSDVTFKCGDSTFSAHRSILSVRSDVFAAMFQNKLVESETGVIDITDIDGSVFELFLKYVYSGKVTYMNGDTASSLYLAGNKYAVQNLKIESSRWMLKNLSIENCFDFLCLAHTCNDDELKDRLVTFISEIVDLIDEQEWHKFREEHPNLALSVLEIRTFPKKAKKA